MSLDPHRLHRATDIARITGRPVKWIREAGARGELPCVDLWGSLRFFSDTPDVMRELGHLTRGPITAELLHGVEVVADTEGGGHQIRGAVTDLALVADNIDDALNHITIDLPADGTLTATADELQALRHTIHDLLADAS